MNETICYVHGLNATHLSFAYIVNKIGDHEYKLINYQSHQSLQDSIDEVSKSLPKGPLILVGHSLGGVIAMNIAHNRSHDIKKVITISSPLGGSKSATYLQYFSKSSRIVADITPISPGISKLTAKSPCPVLSIISTAGHLATTNELNDSVVTLNSQGALVDAKKILIPANHFEVLNHDKTVTAINKFVSA